MLAMDEAFVLGGNDVRNLTFVGCKVIFNFSGSILVLALEENGGAPNLTTGVGHATGIKLIVGEIDLDVFSAQFHVLVFHHGIAIQIGHAPGEVIDGRVGGAIGHHG